MILYNTHRKTLTDRPQEFPDGRRPSPREFISIEAVAGWLDCEVKDVRYDAHNGEWQRNEYKRFQ